MHTYKHIIDISIPLNASTIVYPGDPQLEIMPESHGQPLPRLSKITIGSHMGTHVDAPNHFIDSGVALDQIPLEHFVGPCRVLDMTQCTGGVTRADLEGQNIQTGEKILLKTKNSALDYDAFRTDYIYIAPDAARYLADIGVSLVGIDYLSVKQKGSPDNTAHLAFLEKNIPILETIRLTNVDPGNYFLCAQPLAFTGIDGSPVRALLMK